MISLRKCTESDWEKIVEFEKLAASAVYFAIKDEQKVKEYLCNEKVFLILLEGSPVSSISYEEKNDHIEFTGLTVSPQYRKKGIAANALKLVFDQGLNKPYSLVTHPQNTPALLLYLKHGFKIVGWKDNYFGDGEPRILLQLKQI